jgi:hypothetical protein
LSLVKGNYAVFGGSVIDGAQRGSTIWLWKLLTPWNRFLKIIYPEIKARTYTSSPVTDTPSSNNQQVIRSTNKTRHTSKFSATYFEIGPCKLQDEQRTRIIHRISGLFQTEEAETYFCVKLGQLRSVWVNVQLNKSVCVCGIGIIFVVRQNSNLLSILRDGTMLTDTILQRCAIVTCKTQVLMAVKIPVPVFRVVTQCKLTCRYHSFCSEDGSSMFLRNIGIFQSRRMVMWWETEMFRTCCYVTPLFCLSVRAQLPHRLGSHCRLCRDITTYKLPT